MTQVSYILLVWNRCARFNTFFLPVFRERFCSL